MGFKLARTETFQMKVEVDVVDDNGAWSKDSFIAFFKRAPESEREELSKLGNAELVRNRLVGWKMKDDATGQDVPFDEDTKRAFFELTSGVAATAVAFWQGNVGAKEKNSSR